MSRLLLSTAVAGLMLGVASPALANNLTTDCQTQLSDIRNSLQQEQFSQSEQRNINQMLRQAEQAGERECLQIVSSLEDEYLDANNGERFALQRGTSGEQIIVEQSDPQVSVQQPAPRVQVEQVAPEVSITQGQPEVIIEQPPPQIVVRQPAPEVIVTQDKPQVSVRVPEPEVGVTQEDVKVSVTQAEPNVSVEQAQPDIEIVQPRPSVVLEEGQPEVTITQEDPRVRVNERNAAAVDIQRSEAEVTLDQERPEVDVQRVGEADIEYRAAQIEPEAGTETRAQDQATRQDQALTQDQTEFQAETGATADATTGLDTQVVIARDIMGMDITSIDGTDLGDVEDIVYDNTGQYYLVVTSGGFLGIGEEHHLVPMDRVSYGTDALIIMSEGDLMTGYDQNRFTSVEPDFEMETGTL